MKWLDDFFSWCEHKINNTGWIWNGDEREGWNEAKPKGNAERFSNLHFLDQKWSKDLEFLHLQNWEDSANIWQMCTKHTVMSTDSAVLFYAQKARQKNQSNEGSRLLKSSALSQHKIWRSLLTIWIYYIAAKTTTSLWNELKGKIRKMQSD